MISEDSSHSTPDTEFLAGMVHALKTEDSAAISVNWQPPSDEDMARLLPRLESVHLIGRGGMGAVYRAMQKDLKREVAVKILPPELAKDACFVERFRREAQALGRLQHPNIVTIFEFGSTAEGHLYFVMEFVDGTDLQQLVQSGGIPITHAYAIVKQVCDALQCAHEQGIVHRDIKPGNILVDKTGQVKVADFGLAKLMQNDDPAQSKVTQVGSVMGTPCYSAPEQLCGKGAVDHRADIFSLGVMLYEMLTGTLPQGHFDPPSRKVQVDVRMDEIVLKALAQDPERRYQHISEVRTALDDVESGSVASTRKGTADTRQARPATQRLLLWSAVSFGLVATVIAVFFNVKNQEDNGSGSEVSPLRSLIQEGTRTYQKLAKPLADQRPVVVGSGEEQRIGFETLGPTIDRNAPMLIPQFSGGSASEYRITRLYFTEEDLISIGPNEAKSRKLNLWLPRSEGPFCNVRKVEDAPRNNDIIKLEPARKLPDGAYCLHCGPLSDKQPPPAYSTTFIVGGLPKMRIVSAKATVNKGSAKLLLELANTGTGEFNEGRMIITLQKSSRVRGEFKGRWERKVSAVPPGDTMAFEQDIDLTKMEPADYYFYGHLNLDHVFTDSEGVFDHFKTNNFSL